MPDGFDADFGDDDIIGKGKNQSDDIRDMYRIYRITHVFVYPGFFEEIRAHFSGIYPGYPDTVFREFILQGFRESGHSPFARNVDRSFFFRDESVLGVDIDDSPSLSDLHAGDDGLGDEHRSGEIGFDGFADRLPIIFFQGTFNPNSGIIDQAVDRFISIENVLDAVSDTVFIAHVQNDALVGHGFGWRPFFSSGSDDDSVSVVESLGQSLA